MVDGTISVFIFASGNGWKWLAEDIEKQTSFFVIANVVWLDMTQTKMTTIASLEAMLLFFLRIT